MGNRLTICSVSEQKLSDGLQMRLSSWPTNANLRVAIECQPGGTSLVARQLPKVGFQLLLIDEPNLTIIAEGYCSRLRKLNEIDAITIVRETGISN